MSFEEDLDRALTDAGVPHQGQAGDAKGAIARIGILGGKCKYYEDMIRNIRLSIDAAENPGQAAPPAPHENGGIAHVPPTPPSKPRSFADVESERASEVVRVDKKKALIRAVAEGILSDAEAHATQGWATLLIRAPVGWFKKQDMVPEKEDLSAMVENLRTRGIVVPLTTVTSWAPLRRSVVQLWIEEGGDMPEWLGEFRDHNAGATASPSEVAESGTPAATNGNGEKKKRGRPRGSKNAPPVANTAASMPPADPAIDLDGATPPAPPPAPPADEEISL